MAGGAAEKLVRIHSNSILPELVLEVPSQAISLVIFSMENNTNILKSY